MKLVKKAYLQIAYIADELEREYPGPISNEKILKGFNKYMREDNNPADPTNFALKTKALEGRDYKLIPKKCWDILFKRFGGGPELARQKDTDYYSRKYIIKFAAVIIFWLIFSYQIPLMILPPLRELNPDVIRDQKKDKIFMQAEQTFKQLKQKIVRILNLQHPDYNFTDDSIRIWKSNTHYTKPENFADFLKNRHIGGPDTEIKSDDSQTPEIEENTGIDFPGLQLDILQDKTWKEVDRTNNNISFNYDLIVVEVQAKGSPFIFRYNKNPGQYGKCENCYQTSILKAACQCKKVFYCNLECLRKDRGYHLPKCEYENDISNVTFEQEPNAKKGVVGLNNLGNTCFMNSALQCLSNIWPLTKYFLATRFKEEINENNPLGTKGVLATQYALLLNALWNKAYDVFSPHQLKKEVAKKNPMFEGYNQHDSQEFLNSLLDSLHEDLNRVYKKPYVEQSESANRPDQLVAQEHWEGHLKRNQSIIVDLMQGQYKSTL